MARQVYGNITDKAGPLSKLVVEAWDSDPDGDDFMGRTITDKAGDYRIEYAGGHWDPVPPEITTRGSHLSQSAFPLLAGAVFRSRPLQTAAGPSSEFASVDLPAPRRTHAIGQFQTVMGLTEIVRFAGQS